MIKYVSNECQIECKISERMAEALPWLNVWLWGAPFLCVSLMFSTYLGSVGSDVSGLHLNSFRHMSVLWLGAVLCCVCAMVGICSGHGCVEGRKSLLKNPVSGVGSCWKACGDVLAVGQFAAHPSPPHV